MDVLGAKEPLVERHEAMIFEILGPEAVKAEVGVAGEEGCRAHGAAARQVLHVDRSQHLALMAHRNEDARIGRDLFQPFGENIARHAAVEGMAGEDLGRDDRNLPLPEFGRALSDRVPHVLGVKEQPMHTDDMFPGLGMTGHLPEAMLRHEQPLLHPGRGRLVVSDVQQKLLNHP